MKISPPPLLKIFAYYTLKTDSAFRRYSFQISWILPHFPHKLNSKCGLSEISSIYDVKKENNSGLKMKECDYVHLVVAHVIA